MTPLAIIRSADGYGGLQRALRARWLALRVSGETLDDVSGLCSRYAGKLLSPYPPKNIGAQSLGPLLGSLAVALVLIEDEEMTARIGNRFERKKGNASIQMLPQKRKRKSIWKGSTDWGLIMNGHRTNALTDKQRSTIARKAARARWASPSRSTSLGKG